MTPSETVLLPGTGPHREEALDRAVCLLLEGELVAFPTETVYGLGALATAADAVARVFVAKGRPSDNPLIVHLASPREIDLYARPGPVVSELAAAFMPGPLTLVLPSRQSIPAIVRAGLPSVALRIPDHPLALELLERTGPLVAPSANRSGRPSPTRASHVVDDLDGRIAAVLDGGSCRVGIESTVLDLCSRTPRILRPGTISAADIAAVIGPVATADPRSGDQSAAPPAPGMKYRHYAPAIPVELHLLEEVEGEEGFDLKIDFKADESVLLLLSEQFEPEKVVPESDRVAVRRLDEESLFTRFREAEKEGVDRIVVVARRRELSEGMLNRLQKAAAS